MVLCNFHNAKSEYKMKWSDIRFNYVCNKCSSSLLKYNLMYFSTHLNVRVRLLVLITIVLNSIYSTNNKCSFDQTFKVSWLSQDHYIP